MLLRSEYIKESNTACNIGTILVGKDERVATSITIGESRRKLSLFMRRLMNIADVVNQEKQRVGLRKIGLTGVEPILDVVVHVAIKVVIAVVLAAEPLDDGFYLVGEIVCIGLEVVVLRVIVQVVRLVYEVEVRLPSTAVILYFVGESSKFISCDANVCLF